jgi:hypothetical protein
MNDTPRTDASLEYPEWSACIVVPASLCRELERENTALRAEVERVNEHLKSAYARSANFFEMYRDQQQRAEAAEAAHMRISLLSETWPRWDSHDLFDEAREIARAALAGKGTP